MSEGRGRELRTSRAADERLIRPGQAPGPGSGGASSVHQLQRQVGNASTVALLSQARGPVVQRDETKDGGGAGAPVGLLEGPKPPLLLTYQAPLLLTDVPWDEFERRRAEGRHPASQKDVESDLKVADPSDGADSQATDPVAEEKAKRREAEEAQRRKKAEQREANRQKALDEQKTAQERRLKEAEAKEKRRQEAEDAKKKKADQKETNRLKMLQQQEDAEKRRQEKALALEAKQKEDQLKAKKARQTKKQATQTRQKSQAEARKAQKEEEARRAREEEERRKEEERRVELQRQEADRLRKARANYDTGYKDVDASYRRVKATQAQYPANLRALNAAWAAHGRLRGKADTPIDGLTADLNSIVLLIEQAEKDQRWNRLAQEGLVSINNEEILLKTLSGLPTEDRAAVQECLEGMAGRGEWRGGRTRLSDGGWKAGKWGAHHHNNEGFLPAGVYKEYYVRPRASEKGFGTRRIVQDESRNRIYYTGTHYAEQKRKGAFVKLRVDG